MSSSSSSHHHEHPSSSSHSSSSLGHVPSSLSSHHLLRGKTHMPTLPVITDAPTSTNGKSGSMHGYHHSTNSGNSSPDSEEYDHFDTFPVPGDANYYDPYCMPMYSGGITQTPVQYHPNGGFPPYEVDVKTERQMFVNDVPTRRDSSISTFSTWVPPMVGSHHVLPSYPSEDWSHSHHSSTDPSYYPHHPPPHHSTDLEPLSHEDDDSLDNFDFNTFPYPHPSQQPHPTPNLNAPQPLKTDLPPPTTSTTLETDAIPITPTSAPLLTYTLTHIPPLLFPLLPITSHSPTIVRDTLLLPALTHNAAYLHACLTAAAVHQRACLGTSLGPQSITPTDLQEIDDAIVRHKYSFVQEVVTALTEDSHHEEILEATLGMIVFGSCVGRAPPPPWSQVVHDLPSPGAESEFIVHPPTVDALHDDLGGEADHHHSTTPILANDIPWHSHFQATTELVSKLLLPQTLESLTLSHHHTHGTSTAPPFNMTLTSWIDILGAPLLARSPLFSSTYRTLHLSGTPAGLSDLMGCHDGIMYLLSEIACLDSLIVQGKLGGVEVCQHVASLGEQLNATEMRLKCSVGPVYRRDGSLKPKQLQRNLTAVWAKAARVYLCSLVPEYVKSSPATVSLVDGVVEVLEYIPVEWDRCLVWPFLIVGGNSVRGCRWREVLEERCALRAQEEQVVVEMGSFGRMRRVLAEVWRLEEQGGGCGVMGGVGAEGTPVTAAGEGSPGQTMGAGGEVKIVPNQVLGQVQQNVHWRDVMQVNGWDWLLI